MAPINIGRRVLAALVTGAIGATMLAAPAGAAKPDPRPPARQKVPDVKVKAVPVAPQTAAKPLRQAADLPQPVWPAPGSVEIAATEPTGAAGKAAGKAATGAVTGKVRVATLDRATTARAGVEGVLLRVGRSDGISAPANAQVKVDYSKFATAYGADWSTRLRLVALPDCALTTPSAAACAGAPLPSVNDPATRTVSASVTSTGQARLVALTAGASGTSGSYAATPLKASSTWSIGGNSGAFTWSYPMRVPPPINGPAPQVALNYTSQSVDGMHAATNNQPSWVGEGFDSAMSGFVERRYKPCSDDMNGSANNDKKTGDLCWETDNAVMSLAGHSGELIKDSAGKWHLRSDDGSRIERRTGAANGDDNGEFWVLTTVDGVQYWFGAQRLPGWAAGNAVTNSTFTAPIFGNDPGEPCHATAFIDSDCTQAWRWNLDYVVDLSGNSISYWYTKETNKYGRNLKADDAAQYDRGGYLEHIDYGTRRINGVDSVLGTTAPLRVDLGPADRCLSSCGTHDATHWPDVPWDQSCTGDSCADKFYPTFWSAKRLGTVTTQVRSGTTFRNIERWTLNQTFPDPGDGTRAGLWLNKIAHDGLNGATTDLPDIEFTPVQLANRVDTIDFAAAMNWMRITKIRSESGGTVSVNYSAEDCKAGQARPAPESNSKLCYPVIWVPEGYENPVTDWFHKYVVKTIYENDNTGGVPPQGSPRVVHSYDYSDPGWHYNDDDGLTGAKFKTWSDFRGFATVTETTGDPGEQTSTVTRYFRGLNGDRAAPSGGAKTISVDGIADEDWYSGQVREAKTLNGPGGAVVSRDTNVPWSSPATASRTINGDTVTARFNKVGSTTRYTTLDGGRAARVTKVNTTYDSLGMPTEIDDLGVDGVDGDEQCTRNDYSPRNTDIWLVNLVHRVQTYAVKCASTGGTLTDADVIGETRTSFDGNAFEATPTQGLPTQTQAMAAWNSGAPTFITKEKKAYDVHGRVTSTWDTGNALTTMAYTPATDGPLTATLVTNPLGHKVSTTLDPGYNQPTAIVDANDKRTDLTYDGLGRLAAVWQPGRVKGTDTATSTFTYAISATAASYVKSTKLNAAGGTISSYEIYDGMLRTRQTQSQSPSGGRIITESFYDSAGRLTMKFDAYHNTGTASGALVTTTDKVFVPNQKRLVYDGVGRTTAEIFQPYGAERWRTSTSYTGDRTDITPPQGGTATSKVVDARDRVTEVRQYKGAAPTPGTDGSWDSTTYQYDRKGQLTQLTDADGNAWKYGYDLRGNQISFVDPDKGTSSSTYDNAGRVATTTDARGKKVAYLYDTLGRKRAAYDNQVGGTLRASWTFDGVVKGYLSQSVRMVGTAPYALKFLGYNDSYQPSATQAVIPDSETGLGGTYNFTNTYNPDGSTATSSIPSTRSDMPAETLSFTYDGLSNTKSLSSLLGTTNLTYVADTDYNALGQLDQFEQYTGTGGRVYRSFQRELETNRVTEIRTDRDTVTPATVQDLHYTYDPAGNVTKLADTAPETVDDTQCYKYDYLRRLTNAWTPSSGDCAAAPTTAGLGGPAPYWQSWTFDAVGNRKSHTDHRATGDATTSYTYPTGDAPQPHTLTSTSGAKTGAYTYDASGNLLTRPNGAGTQTLKWDAEGFLESATDSSGTTSFIYDADGNRLIRRDPTGRTLYLPGEEIRYNAATATNSCIRYYAYGGSLIASRTAAGLTWLATDIQGTPLAAINAADQSSKVRRQTPYGDLRADAGAWPNDRGFVGGTTDNTGLTHLGAREYDPTAGRFISADPLMDPMNPQQLNGYSYSSNNPTTFSDPTGEMLIADGGGGGGGSSWWDFVEEAIKIAKAAARRAWLGSQINKRHQAAQEVAFRQIQKQVKAMGGKPENVEIEFEIEGACKSHKECGNSGRADIVYYDEQHKTIYVWEVKSYKGKGSLKASKEVQFYIKKLRDTGDYKSVKPGFKVLPEPMFNDVPGSDEYVIVSNGTQGALPYRTRRVPRKPAPPPEPVPVPVPVPEPQKVPEPTDDHGWRPNWWVVGGAVLVGGAAIACTVASAGVCGVVIAGGVIGGAAASA